MWLANTMRSMTRRDGAHKQLSLGRQVRTPPKFEALDDQNGVPPEGGGTMKPRKDPAGQLEVAIARHFAASFADTSARPSPGAAAVWRPGIAQDKLPMPLTGLSAVPHSIGCKEVAMLQYRRDAGTEI
jgi:hypothetical protein